MCKSAELVEDIRPRLNRLAAVASGLPPVEAVKPEPEEEDKQVFLAFNSWMSCWELSSAPDPVVVVFVILAIGEKQNI